MSSPSHNMPILIRKVADDHGWLGNMSPYPVTWEGKQFRTTEALFQSMRFKDEDIIEEIRSQKSPMAAKMIAKRYKARMVVVPMSEEDLQNMKLVLGLKVEQHPEIGSKLIETGTEEIIEDCTRRARGSGLFWGSALVDGKLGWGKYVGRNVDGDSGEVEQRLNCPITFSVPDDEFVGRLAVALKGFYCWICSDTPIES